MDCSLPVQDNPLFMGFSRQEHYSRLPCPPPGDLPDPGIEPTCLTSPALAGRSLPLVPHGKPLYMSIILSQFLPPTPLASLVFMFVHYICIFISAFNRIIYTTFLDSTYIKILCSNATGVFKSGGGKPDSILRLHQICTIKYEYEVAQLCLTLCNPVDCSLPDSSVHAIFQARILEWVAISFSRGFSPPRVRTWVSHAAGTLFTV